MTIQKGTPSCSTARKVLRAFLTGKGTLHGPVNGPAYKQTYTVGAWTCGTGTGGGACFKGGTNYKSASSYIIAQQIQ